MTLERSKGTVCLLQLLPWLPSFNQCLHNELGQSGICCNANSNDQREATGHAELKGDRREKKKKEIKNWDDLCVAGPSRISPGRQGTPAFPRTGCAHSPVHDTS